MSPGDQRALMLGILSPISLQCQAFFSFGAFNDNPAIALVSGLAARFRDSF
jgi:hypothetical protein